MTQVKMGALYLDNVVQINPKQPTCDGDIPAYDGSSGIAIAEAPKNRPDTFITWNIVPSMEKWSRTGTLLIADRVLLSYVSWDDLETAGFIDGIEVVLKGQKYRCHLLPVDKDFYPMGEFADPIKQMNVNAWDDALDRTTENNSVWNWKHIFFWINGFEPKAHHRLSMTRGYSSPRFRGWNSAPYRVGNVGFRPVLEPLESDNSFDDAAAAKQNTAEKQKIRVIIRDGIVENVLSIGAAAAPDVEIVAINKNYEDCRELNEYADRLCADPKCKEVDFKLVHFGNGKEPL